MAYVGLGDEFSPSQYLDALGVDVSGWDWHEWALAGIGAYLVIRTLYRGGKVAKRAASRKVRKVRSSVGRRKAALKTVFTG